MPGANCTIGVTFTPGQTGNLNETLSVSDDAVASPQTVALSGTGTVAGQCQGLGRPCDILPCCPGLVCKFSVGSTRVSYKCELGGSENTSSASSFWGRLNANTHE